jgi:hypothetical protein
MILKFRAWDKTRNEMNYRVMVGNCDTDDENWTCPTIWIEERKKWLHFDDYECIMQSTGLKDKNGKEIFEGDVISTYTDNLVIKRDNLLGFYVEVGEKRNYFAETVDIEYLDLFAKDFGVAVEVLGNIYENPELLEEK